MSKWIDFIKMSKISGRKTDIYQVVTKDGLSLLGQISWYAAWRKYTFQPNSNCVFETQCLTDIVIFLNNLMIEHKTQKSLPDLGKGLKNNDSQ